MMQNIVPVRNKGAIHAVKVRSCPADENEERKLDKTERRIEIHRRAGFMSKIEQAYLIIS